MRQIIVLAFILLSFNALGQRLVLEKPLEPIGSYPSGECPMYDDTHYCVVIDIIVPRAEITNLDCGGCVFKEEPHESGNGIRYFIVPPSKQKDVRLFVKGYHDYTFKLPKDLIGSEVYEMSLTLPEFAEKNDAVFKEHPFFFGYTFSPSAPIGVSAGYCKQFGGFISGGFSPLVFNKFSFDEVYSSLLLTEEQKDESYNHGKYRYYIHLGGMYRPTSLLAVYVSGGYGAFADVSEYDLHYFAPKRHCGIESSVGVMLKINKIGLSAGYTKGFAGDGFGDFSVGAQMWF